MSSKAVSYYDWSLGFKKSSIKQISDDKSSTKNLNSLGIAKDKFKNHLKTWKEKNLSI